MKNIFQQWAEKAYWFLPTKSDQIKNRKNELNSIKQEYVEVLSKLIAFGEDMGNLEDKLVATFSEEQHKLWLDLKVLAQKTNFQSTRKTHFDERLKEIPNEISELLNPLTNLYQV